MKTLVSAKSHYSFLSSLLSVETLCFHAASKGYKAVVLADKDYLFGFQKFRIACEKYQLKAIYGCQFIIDQQSFTVIAQNNQGYLELIALSKQVNSQSSLTYVSFCEMVQNCYVIVNSHQLFGLPTTQWDEQVLLDKLSQFKSDFTYPLIGLSLQQSTLYQEKNKEVLNMCQTLEIDAIINHPISSISEQDAESLVLLQAIDELKSIHDTSLYTHKYEAMLSTDEMLALYGESLCNHTDVIFANCQVNLRNFKTSLPTFQNDYQVSSEIYLSQLAKAGLKKRFHPYQPTQPYWQRLEHELAVILQCKFADYFLIVYDLILFAKKQGIMIGPARGSSGASLVAYCLGITQVDPIKHQLIFERFLNPQRVSMPDIDIDIMDTKRDLVIKYLQEKFGTNHVGHIVTFSTLSQKAVVRDVARAYQLEKNSLDKMLSALVNSPNAKLMDSFKQSKSLQSLLKVDRKCQKVFDMAIKLEGLPKTMSFHPAGIVLSTLPLHQLCPVFEVNQQALCVGFEMDVLEAMGLIKIDLLALRNLTLISNILSYVDNLKLDSISYDDKKTFALLTIGQTLGIFQLESLGMIQLLKQVKIDQFDDLIAVLALYRPGPMDQRKKYIENKHDAKLIVKLNPVVDEILAGTFGVIIYQEQVMEIARKLAGFSYAKADILRKAMSKKNSKEMEKLKSDFFSGVGNEQLANEIWILIERFASYGFNKAHSVGYAMISYQLAYLKCHYPLAFYQAYLNTILGSKQKISLAINECRQRNIDVLPVSINHSTEKFFANDHKLVCPLTLIEDLPESLVLRIVQIRQQVGGFSDYFDAIAHLNTFGVKAKQLESLIYAGAFDEFKLSRATMSATLEQALQYANIIRVDLNEKTLLNKALVNPPQIISQTESRIVLSMKEKEALGFYFNYHPIKTMRDDHSKIPLINQIVNTTKSTSFIAMVTQVREITTKRNQKMAFVEVEDEISSIRLIFFPNVYQQLNRPINRFDCLLITGVMDEEKQFIVRRVAWLNGGNA